jgi:hypothetical protein
MKGHNDLYIYHGPHALSPALRRPRDSISFAYKRENCICYDNNNGGRSRVDADRPILVRLIRRFPYNERLLKVENNGNG